MALAALQPLKPKALGKALSAAPALLEFMQQEGSPEVSITFLLVRMYAAWWHRAVQALLCHA